MQPQELQDRAQLLQQVGQTLPLGAPGLPPDPEFPVLPFYFQREDGFPPPLSSKHQACSGAPLEPCSIHGHSQST